jgi:PII-like signaling protein
MQMRLHFGERDRCGDEPLESAVMNACARRAVRAAALMRGVEGFGARQHLRTDRLLSLSEDTPLIAVAVGEDEVIERLADEVREMAGKGLMVLESTEVFDGDVGKATIWGPRTGPTSPHLGAVAALKRHGAESATVLLGVDGVLDGERRRARFVAANQGVPAMTVGVGPRVAIDAAVAEINGAAHLVTVEAVETYRRIGTVSLHTDAAVERSSRIAGVSLHGPAEAVRVTLVTSEVASRGSHPVYVEFIHRLRREGAAGATAQRGVWGFRGEEEPHGDRVLALRRDVPMRVEVVDAPERAARWHEVARELACEGDILYSEAVGRRFTLE